MMEDSVIIGGGIAGLTAAFRLRLAGKQVKCLEAEPAAGGCVQTDRTQGFQCERGAQNFLEAERGSVYSLAQALGITDQIKNADDTANFVAWNNKLWKVPQALHKVCSVRGLARGMAELCVPPSPGDGDESVAQWGQRRFGREVSQRLLEPMLASNCGGDPERLSAQSVCPAGIALERYYGSVILGSIRKRQTKRLVRSFTFGMGTLTEALARELGPDLLLNSEVIKLAKADRTGYRLTLRDNISGRIDASLTARTIVVATPAPAAALMLADVDRELSALLKQILYAGLTSVWLGYAASDVKEKLPRGYGLIRSPYREHNALGCIFCSSLFSSAAPTDHVLTRLMFGGRANPRISMLSDNDLIALAQWEMKSLFGISRGTNPAFAHIARQPLGLPQYELGHRDRLQQIESRIERWPGLHLIGNAYRGIPVPAVVSDAEQVANKLRECY